MSGDVQVRICEGLKVRFLWATRRNIYVKSQRAGERVLTSVKEFLGKYLKLRINETKSACARVDERQFLGYRLLSEGKLVIAQHSLERIRDKVRRITRRNRGVSLETVTPRALIREINTVKEEKKAGYPLFSADLRGLVAF